MSIVLLAQLILTPNLLRGTGLYSYPSFTKINGLQYENSKNSFTNSMLDGEDRDPEGDTDYYFSARCTL